MNNNPFASLDLHLLRVEKVKDCKKMPNFDQQLNQVDISRPNGVRDRVVLLLRYKYKLWPGEISMLNISDVDLSGGVIHILRQNKKLVVVIDECDFLDFRRWASVRKLYVNGLDAFFNFDALDTRKVRALSAHQRPWAFSNYSKISSHGRAK